MPGLIVFENFRLETEQTLFLQSRNPQTNRPNVDIRTLEYVKHHNVSIRLAYCN